MICKCISCGHEHDLDDVEQDKIRETVTFVPSEEAEEFNDTTYPKTVLDLVDYVLDLEVELGI